MIIQILLYRIIGYKLTWNYGSCSNIRPFYCSTQPKPNTILAKLDDTLIGWLLLYLFVFCFCCLFYLRNMFSTSLHPPHPSAQMWMFDCKSMTIYVHVIVWVWVCVNASLCQSTRLWQCVSVWGCKCAGTMYECISIWMSVWAKCEIMKEWKCDCVEVWKCDSQSVIMWVCECEF